MKLFTRFRIGDSVTFQGGTSYTVIKLRQNYMKIKSKELFPRIMPYSWNYVWTTLKVHQCDLVSVIDRDGKQIYPEVEG